MHAKFLYLAGGIQQQYWGLYQITLSFTIRNFWNLIAISKLYLYRSHGLVRIYINTSKSTAFLQMDSIWISILYHPWALSVLLPNGICIHLLNTSEFILHLWCIDAKAIYAKHMISISEMPSLYPDKKLQRKNVKVPALGCFYLSHICTNNRTKWKIWSYKRLDTFQK